MRSFGSFLALLPLLACTGDELSAPVGAPADKTAKFLGTWTTQTATQELSNCKPALNNKKTDNVPISLEVKKGSTSDILVNNTLAPSCVFSVNVEGDVGTFLGGQACNFAFQDGSMQTYTYDNSDFKLDPNGLTGTMTIRAKIVSKPNNVTCDFTEVAPYAKR